MSDFVVFGAIGDKYAEVQGLLGAPTSNEMPTHDGVGRFQTFAGGIIVWHPDTGAFEVHGDILTRYGELGGSAWAYPVSDELAIGDGRGRFSRFRQLPGGFDMNIYWTPETGAHETFGQIFLSYGSLGWQGGLLGYPLSGELVTHDGVGRFQIFEGGQIVWHPETGAFEVHGDILGLYGALGGSAWGYPITNETSAPDGRGRFNHFRNVEGGFDTSIYWTQEHGAHPLIGLIRHAWLTYTGHASLGYPTSGEMVTHDGVGRWQTFENCSYIWHPTTGAHEVHGAIEARYHEIGGSNWGYPLTDETKTPDGVGRYNHFRHVESGGETSIYWSPSTGAHEIYGPVRVEYANLGWEQSFLGYPIGPEYTQPSTNNRIQEFSCGYIRYLVSSSGHVDYDTRKTC